MFSTNERVFVTGATGDIGNGVVRGLIKKGIDTTAYIVVGTYSTVDVFTKAIQGHTRLFLLFGAQSGKPTDMSQVKEAFAKIAFEKGIRQVVDLSSASVTSFGKKGIIGYMHTAAEDKLWTLADEKPEQRSLVVLRPGSFMTNHFMGDVHHIKHSNKLVSCGSPSSVTTWIDTRDISDCVVVVLSESVEKHDRNVYEMSAEALTHEHRAAIFSKVFGKTITYEQQSLEEFYKTLTGFGLAHSFVYDLVLLSSKDICNTTTPEISLIIGRPLHTLEDWLKENIKAFQ